MSIGLVRCLANFEITIAERLQELKEQSMGRGDRIWHHCDVISWQR